MQVDLEDQPIRDLVSGDAMLLVPGGDAYGQTESHGVDGLEKLREIRLCELVVEITRLGLS